MDDKVGLRDLEEGARKIEQKARWADLPKYARFIGPSLMLISYILESLHYISPTEQWVLFSFAFWLQFNLNASNLKFLGSTVALIIGAFYLAIVVLYYLIGIKITKHLDPIPWIEMVLGALAYKSLKKRSLGMVENTFSRQFLEIVGMLVILGLLGLQKESIPQLATFPLLYLLIPIWAFIAYGTLYLRK